MTLFGGNSEEGESYADKERKGEDEDAKKEPIILKVNICTNQRRSYVLPLA
jgi:hypothetical protein